MVVTINNRKQFAGQGTRRQNRMRSNAPIKVTGHSVQRRNQFSPPLSFFCWRLRDALAPVPPSFQLCFRSRNWFASAVGIACFLLRGDRSRARVPRSSVARVRKVLVSHIMEEEGEEQENEKEDEREDGK